MPKTSIDFLPAASSLYLLALITVAIIAFLAVRLFGGRASKLSRRAPIFVLRATFVVLLLSLLLNPVQLSTQDGAIEPARAFFLLDASQSMAIGDKNETRWRRALQLIRGATELAADDAVADVTLFRFGRRLKAFDSVPADGLDETSQSEIHGVRFVNNPSTVRNGERAETVDPAESLDADEPDTQLLVALRQLSSRFGRKPPNAIVVFSDGRARDEARLEEVASYFSDLGVPIHTVPIGDAQSGGDIAFVSLVMPSDARKQSQVQTQAFLRSYGYDGQQVDVQLNAIEADGTFIKRMASLPVTLRSGFQPVPFSFRTDDEPRLLEAVVSKLSNEIATDNNRLEAELSISREKIRVLYYEGGSASVDGNGQVDNPAASLSKALRADREIDCVVIPAPESPENGSIDTSPTAVGRPRSATDLAAFDAIIFSDVSPRVFTPDQLAWMESWVRQRGGGICMLGGPKSYAAGKWNGTVLATMLPVGISEDFDWNESFRSVLKTDVGTKTHPLFQLVDDQQLNDELIREFPRFIGANVNLLPKPNLATVLAIARENTVGENLVDIASPNSLFSAEGIQSRLENLATATEPDNEFAAITVGQYGKGRTMAIALPTYGIGAEAFLTWGPGEENTYYQQFMRNAVYWLTEQSFIGRRRLIAETDKRYYGPGDTITLTAKAFGKDASETSGYRIVGRIEPQSFDNIESDYSIIRWPSNVPREEPDDSPFAVWGEKFDVTVQKEGERNLYKIELPIADTLPRGITNQSMRLELTAYQGSAQVDSTSVPIQILHDPFEQQNPFPNHELLKELAQLSGGQVIVDDKELANLLTSLPITRGPSESTKTPLWNTWWVLVLLLAILTSEWCYRRWIGLA